MKTHLIYLAAGSAKRFGSNKLLYPLNGKPLFQYGLETLHKIKKLRGDCTITVVSRYPEILDTANNLDAIGQYCEESIHGISHSIRCGIQSLESLSPEDYLLFMVADQPYISVDTLLRLLETTKLSPLAACVCYGKRVGNPAIFSATLADELCRLEGDQGGRTVLKNLSDACLLVPCNTEQELEDIDTPEKIINK